MGNSMSSTSGAPKLASATAIEGADKPKPCCVCKDEKAKRDECMLMSSGADPGAECKTTIEAYRQCMAGYGFKI